MKWDRKSLTIVAATGAGVVAGLVLTGALIGAGFWAAVRLEHRAQARNANTTRRLP